MTRRTSTVRQALGIAALGALAHLRETDESLMHRGHERNSGPFAPIV